jgi:DNA-binding response OmpR family regulator
MKHILIVEDDPAIVKGIGDALADEHYEVSSAADGEKGYVMAKRENIDLIILDIMLPRKNGMEICRDLRRDGVQTPIIILTSKKQEIDQVLGLELGADDYVTKPFSLNVLLARIKTLLRRKAQASKEIEDYSFGSIELDFRKLEARRHSRELNLSAREFEILRYFILHEGELVTRDMLLTDVWEYGDEETIPTTRTIDNYILSIRKKIEDDPSNPVHVLTVHKAGYKFVKMPSSRAGVRKR